MTPVAAAPARLAPPDDGRQWNPNYLAYCVQRGFAGDPDGMLAHDLVHHPGGHMAPFIAWMHEQEIAFRLERGLPPAGADFLTPAERLELTTWLTARAGQRVAA